MNDEKLDQIANAIIAECKAQDDPEALFFAVKNCLLGAAAEGRIEAYRGATKDIIRWALERGLGEIDAAEHLDHVAVLYELERRITTKEKKRVARVLGLL